MGGKFKIDDFIPNDKLILSKSYIQKISQMVTNKSRDIESFDSKEEMEEFIEEEGMLPLAAMKLEKNIKYYNETFDDAFTSVRYSAYGGLMFITIDPPNSYYYESE